MGRAAWLVRRDRVEARAGLTVMVDLAMRSSMAAREMQPRKPVGCGVTEWDAQGRVDRNC